MEAEEISEFSKQMREAGESSMTHVSLIISVLAVLVAMVTVVGHREHTEAVLMQARAADQWNAYQAHKIRSQQVSVAEDLLSVQSSANNPAVKAKLADYKAHMARWQAESDEDSRQAREFQAEVDVAERKAAHYDLGEALLQIAVVLASITLLTRQQRYVIVALVLGLGGLATAGAALLVH